MGHLGNSNQTLIRHDFKRALYRAMLSEFAFPDILEYFSKIPLVIEGRTLSRPELLQLLWCDKAKIPAGYDAATDNELEGFAISKGRDFGYLMKKILWLNNNSSVMPGKVLLSWFYPKLESLFNSVDARDIVFALITLHNENWMPGIINRRVKKWEDGEWVKSIMVFIMDTTYQEFLDWDLEMIGGPQYMAAPVMVGLPPFEKVGMLADCRPPERVVWGPEDAPEWQGDVLLIGGRPMGKRASFHAFCRRIEVDLGKYSPPDIPVVEMVEDYYCPIRKRIALHRGCAYGAPLFLHTVEHRKLKNMKKDVLSTLVSDLIREEELHKDELEAKHLALLDSLAENAEFRYFPGDESLTLNDSHFTKGVPAKILKYLLEAYKTEGKCEFEYRELKRQFEITLGQKNSNFEIRFYRLVEKLESDAGNLRIEKTGRGKFRLTITGKMEFTIDDG